MTVRTEGETRIEDGTGTVVTIERKTRNAKVSLEVQGLKFPVSAWIDLQELDENIGTDDRVEYEIRKEGDDYRRYVKLAPVSNRDQTPDSAAPQQAGRDDAKAGDSESEPSSGQPESPAERDVPNSDTGRFEGYGYLANVGMVELAFAELLDAYNGGDLDEITPALLDAVSRALLNAADQAQRSLVGGTHRGSQSHTRARGVVRTALLKHPLRAQLNELDAWAADIQKTATRLLALAASL